MHSNRHAVREREEEKIGMRRDDAQPVVSHEVCHLGKILTCCVCVGGGGRIVKIEERNLEPLTFQKLHTFHYMRVRMVHLNFKP